MAIVAQIQGVQKLISQLYEVIRKYEPEGPPEDVYVGFTQNYAVYVHENLQAYHKVGQAKFLEQPARDLQNSGRFHQNIANIVSRGGSLQEALLKSGLLLQREAQLLTPVDTGALKNSAFTALESNLEEAATEAYAQGEAFRQRTDKARLIKKLKQSVKKNKP